MNGVNRAIDKSKKSLVQRIKDFTSVFDALPDPIVLTDKEGLILYTNSAMLSETGFKAAEAIGKKPGMVWGGLMGKKFYDNLWHTLEVEKKPYVGEMQNRKKDGTLYWQELHITPVVDDEGEVQFFVGVAFNITKRKTEEKFRKDFISIVSHQLRNPLQTIGLLTELLSESTTLTKENKKSIELISDENRGLTGFIKDLLTISKIGDNHLIKESVQLQDEIAKIIAEVKTTHTRSAISFKRGRRSFPLITNKRLANQVFANLIYNAAEYADTWVRVTLRTDESGYLFSCSNDGVSISQKDAPHIFSKFFRSIAARKRKEKGDGLGLYIVKTIADEFGWRVWFESSPSKGTTFYVAIGL